MTVLCPGGSMELKSLMRNTFQLSGPVYLRIGKTGEPKIHSVPPDPTITKGLIIKEGFRLCVFSTGNMLPLALETAAKLEKQSIFPYIVSLHTVKPLDTELLFSLAATHPLSITLEVHSWIGGMGSLLAEWCVGYAPKLPKNLRFGTPDFFPHCVGSQNYFPTQYGLTPE